MIGAEKDREFDRLAGFETKKELIFGLMFGLMCRLFPDFREFGVEFGDVRGFF